MLRRKEMNRNEKKKEKQKKTLTGKRNEKQRAKIEKIERKTLSKLSSTFAKQLPFYSLKVAKSEEVFRPQVVWLVFSLFFQLN